MATRKVKFCDNCGKILKPENAFLVFPYYGWQGRIFCNDICLKDWAVKVSKFVNPEKTIINLD